MTDLFETACPCCKRPYDTPEQAGDFAAFWAIVPHKVGKVDAERAFKALKPQDRKIAHDRVRAFYDWFSKTYKDASPLHPVRYIRNKRWLDEAISGEKGAITVEGRQAIIRAMGSKNPSVRDHACRVAAQHGIKQGERA
ncbi:MAG: hypothetical protein WA790_00210 [Sulfitobacter sp.]